MAIPFVITEQGLALISKQIAGGQVIRFKEAALSDQFSQIAPSRTSVTSEKERFPVAISRPTQKRVAVEARVDSKKSYPIREIGIYIVSDDPLKPVLLGISGTPEPFAFASPESVFIINGFIELAALSSPNIQITGPGERLDLTLGEEFVKQAVAMSKLQTIIFDLEERLSRLERR